MSFSSDVLEVATTVKLTRALWILPVAFTLGLWHYRKTQQESQKKITLTPFWYLAGFISMSALFSLIPPLEPWRATVGYIATRGLVVVLFLIGSSLSWKILKSVGPRSFIFGTSLWAVVASALLLAVIRGWIS